MGFASGKIIKLKKKLGPSDTTLTADINVGVTAGRLYFLSTLKEEWIDFDGVSANGDNFDYKNLTRGLSQTANPATGGTGKTWYAGNSAVLIAMHDQLVDRLKDNTFKGTNTFEEAIVTSKGISATEYIDTAARDAALGGDGVATLPYVGIKAGGVFYNYNTSTGQWEDIDTGTTTPNASITAAGKVEIATPEEMDAGTDTGDALAVLVGKPSHFQRKEFVEKLNLTGLTEDTTGNMELDEFVKNDGTGNKKIKINKYKASDAEALEGTVTNKFITPKQGKDNYGLNFISSEAIGSTSGSIIAVPSTANIAIANVGLYDTAGVGYTFNNDIILLKTGKTTASYDGVNGIFKMSGSASWSGSNISFSFGEGTVSQSGTVYFYKSL